MLLLLLLLLPLAGGLATAMLRGRLADLAATGAMVAAVLLALAVVPWGGQPAAAVGPWSPLPGFAFGLRLDGLGALLALVVTVVGLTITAYSTRYYDVDNREHPTAAGKSRYYFFLLTFVTAMLGIAMSPNFFQLFLFWELTTICSWGLISQYGTREALKSGLKALAVTQFASLFFIGGLLLLYVQTGSFDFGAADRLSGAARAAFVVMLLVAAWGKAAQAPMHTWLPSAMVAPTPASAFLHAAAMVKAGIFLAARCLVSTGVLGGWPALLVTVAALITMYVGLGGYFFADDLKRLLAYSTIANLALMLVGIGLGAMGVAAGLEGGLLHLWSHAFTKTLLFLCVGAISWSAGVRSISRLTGLWQTMPLTAAGFLVGALAISGLPPFGVFWSKLLILRAALAVGGAWGWTTGLLILVESALSLAWFLHVARLVLFGSTSEAASRGADPAPVMQAVLGTLMLLTTVAPYVGMPLIHWITGGVG
ncbi:MAG TPA: hydrogenase 4 subunit D [Symbiobacteriaceae bacterium]